MRLTEAGEAFLPFAVRALETLSDGRQVVNAFERGGAGRLALGAAPALSTYVLPVDPQGVRGQPPARAGERAHRPFRGGARPRPARAGRPRARPRAAPPGHRLDAALRGPARARLRPVASVRRSAATIRLEEIGREQLVQFDRTSSYTELTNALFRTAGVRPEAVMELDAIDAAKKMVEAGLRGRPAPPDRGRARSSRPGCSAGRDHRREAAAAPARRNPPARPRRPDRHRRRVPRGRRGDAAGAQPPRPG